MSIFITGTDTGVGETRVAAMAVRALIQGTRARSKITLR